MSERISDIKPADIYSDLSAIEVAEMLAEAAKVDALFQSGQISTLYPASLPAVVSAVAEADPEEPAAAA